MSGTLIPTSVSKRQSAKEWLQFLGKRFFSDAAYFGEENQRLAEQNHVKLVPTAITGTEVPDIYADFKRNRAGNRILDTLPGISLKAAVVLQMETVTFMRHFRRNNV
ncbi:hypothetical protein D3Z36_08145 [Lachnospiraceae bacterium]|nr:hypothetical protein [Lachnospiraceae bacterium]